MMEDTQVSGDAGGRAPEFEPARDWLGLLDQGVSFNGDAAAVGVTSDDRIVVFNRGRIPVTVFDRDGRLLDSWGEGEFDCPHGLTIDADDNLYLVDSRGAHVIHKRSLDGTSLMTLGVRGAGAPAHSGKPFRSPTDLVVHPVTREIFISDGYENSAIHRFDSSGRHISSWGRPGGDPGEFYLPHSIALLDDDHLIVCDRENFRLQIFSCDGAFVDEWRAFRPCTVAVNEGLVYVAELGPTPKFHGQPNLGSRIRILSPEGRRIGTLGADTPGDGANQFSAPHSLAFDSAGSLYVAEVVRSWLDGYLGIAVSTDEEPISVKKWDRIRSSGERQ